MDLHTTEIFYIAEGFLSGRALHHLEPAPRRGKTPLISLKECSGCGGVHG